jgi:hypothetical protein
VAFLQPNWRRNRSTTLQRFDGSINQGCHAAGHQVRADRVHGGDCQGPQAEATKAAQRAGIESAKSKDGTEYFGRKPSYACAAREDMLNPEIVKRRASMSIINFMGQILLGIPFIVLAFWYEQEEALFHTTQTYPHTIYRHTAFGLFFSISFAILGMVFLPPITGTTVLLACIYIFIRSLDNIEEDRVPR